MALIWTDGTWTSESQVGGYRFSYPIDGETSALICEADFVVQRSSYSVPTLGSSATINSLTFYHVGDGPMSDLGGGMVKFTRKWATKPSGHNEWESYAYNFIGYFGSYGPSKTAPTGRDRFTRTVACRVALVYYLVLSGGGGDYTTPADIPIVDETKYYISDSDMEIDWLADNPPFTVATTPTRTTYEGWVAAGTEIVVEPSTLSRWMGPFWVRRTKYVVAL